MGADREARGVTGSMRLLVAVPYYAPAYAFGGSVTVAETMVADIVAAGRRVTVATTDVLDASRRVARTGPPGGEPAVVRFPNLSHRLAAGLNGYLPRGLAGWLRVNVARFDLVLLLDLYSAVSVLAARSAARAGVPYVVQPLGTASPARERGRRLVKRAFLALWGRRTLAEAAAVVHSSDHEAAELIEAGAPPGRLVRLPLPLDLPAVRGEPKADHPTVAFVGRLHPIKGVDRLIEAVALARRSVPDLELDVVGPGDRERRRLQALASRLGVAHAVRFHGFLDSEEKLRLIERAHVWSLLSLSEGLPIAALEAMACGTPVVLSAGCRLPEVDGTAGVVVDGDPGGAASALVALLTDPARRAQLAAGARRFAHSYRREVVMPEMMAALDDVVARAGGAGHARPASRSSSSSA